MRLACTFSVLIALATAGCVKQGHVRERQPLDMFELCSDVRFQKLCEPAFAPVREQNRPIRVDTNLSTPASARTPALG
jgi:hypothetical protein